MSISHFLSYVKILSSNNIYFFREFPVLVMFSLSREIEYITCVSHLIPFFVLISVVSKSIFFKNVDYVEVDKIFS